MQIDNDVQHAGAVQTAVKLVRLQMNFVVLKLEGRPLRQHNQCVAFPLDFEHFLGIWHRKTSIRRKTGLRRQTAKITSRMCYRLPECGRFSYCLRGAFSFVVGKTSSDRNPHSSCHSSRITRNAPWNPVAGSSYSGSRTRIPISAA
jgi:hypothetical protein